LSVIKIGNIFELNIVIWKLNFHQNLYCLDGSMMPGFSCCANPALTIAALAERAMEKIIEEDFV
jgi:cholesterol oxidase